MMSTIYEGSLFIAGVVLIASLISNVEIIAGFFQRIARKVGALFDMPEALEELSARFEHEIELVNNKLHAMQIKNLARIVADNCLPIEARYEAANEYLALGGNGSIKRLFEDEVIPAYNTWLTDRQGIQ